MTPERPAVTTPTNLQGGSKPVPIVIADREFASPGEAARALGVSPSLIRQVFRHGLYPGSRQRLEAKVRSLPPGPTPKKPRPRMAVMIRGELFPTAEAAGERFGVHPNAVRSMVARGRADHIGLGHGSAIIGKSFPQRCRETRLGDLTFPSRRAAADALGIPVAVIHDARRGRASATERLERALQAHYARQLRQAAARESKAMAERTRWRKEQDGEYTRGSTRAPINQMRPIASESMKGASA